MTVGCCPLCSRPEGLDEGGFLVEHQAPWLLIEGLTAGERCPGSGQTPGQTVLEVASGGAETGCQMPPPDAGPCFTQAARSFSHPT